MKEIMAVVGENTPEAAIKQLEKDFDVVIIPPDSFLDEPVKTHPDMIITIFRSCLYCHRKYYVAASNVIDKIAAFGSLEIILSDCIRKKEYPYDIAFNALIADNMLFGRSDYLCPELKKHKVINTRQGYAGCSSLYVCGTVITADMSVAFSARSAGLTVQTVPSGGISLPGYGTGFIGGCCGVTDSSIYICGDPESSPAGIALASFCCEHGISLVSICDGELLDIGGIKFIEKGRGIAISSK